MSKRKREDDVDERESKKIVLGGFNYGTAVPTTYNPKASYTPGQTKFEQLDKNMREYVFDFLNFDQRLPISLVSKSFHPIDFKTFHTLLTDTCIAECHYQYLYHLLEYETVIFEIPTVFYLRVYERLIQYIRLLIQYHKENKIGPNEYFSNGFIIPSLDKYNKIIGTTHEYQFRFGYDVQMGRNEKNKMVFNKEEEIEDQSLMVNNMKNPYPFQFVFYVKQASDLDYIFKTNANKKFFVRPYHQFVVDKLIIEYRDYLKNWSLDYVKNVRVKNWELVLAFDKIKFDPVPIWNQIQSIISEMGPISRLIIQIEKNYFNSLISTLSPEYSNLLYQLITHPLIQLVQIGFDLNAEGWTTNLGSLKDELVQAIYPMVQSSKKPILWSMSKEAIEIFPFINAFITHVSIPGYIEKNVNLHKKWFGHPEIQSYLPQITYLEFEYDIANSSNYNQKQQFFIDYMESIKTYISHTLDNIHWEKEWKMKFDPQNINRIILNRIASHGSMFETPFE